MYNAERHYHVSEIMFTDIMMVSSVPSSTWLSFFTSFSWASSPKEGEVLKNTGGTQGEHRGGTYVVTPPQAYANKIASQTTWLFG